MTTTLDKLDALEHPQPEGAGAPAPIEAAPIGEKRQGWISLVDWRTVLGGLLLAGMVHILLVFAVPANTTGTAYLRLYDALPVNRVVMMPPPVPTKQPLPFMMPDALYAFCRFDVSVDSLRIASALPDAGWTLSLHTPQGDNFYVSPAQPNRTEVNLVLVPGVDRMSEAVPALRRVVGVDAQVAAPVLEGLVMVRAPLKGLAYRAEAEAILARTSCTPIKR